MQPTNNRDTGRDPGSQTPSIGGFKLDGRTIAIGIVVILAAVLLLPRLFNTSGTTDVQPTAAPVSGQSGQSGQPATSPSLGTVVAAASVDRDGCPTNPTSTFNNSDTIYVGVNDSDIPQGTDMFARLYLNGQPIEDTDVITADANYSCVAFAFDATNGAEVLESGSYEAQLFVNGNPGDSVSFTIR